VAGLFAGVAALIYFTGAVVLSLRLAIEHLPWDQVVSQLPREVILSVGAGQVLLPSLVVGAGYVLYRLLRGDRCQPPVLPRSRDGFSTLPRVVWRVILIVLFSFVPLFLIVLYRIGRGTFELEVSRWVISCVILTAAAYLIHELRAILTHHYRRPRDWRSARVIGVMAAFYCLATVPAMVVGAANVALNGAKVCTVDGTEERGVFVGQSSDMVYLGELREENRRLAILPIEKVEEIFVGPEAVEASCEAIPTQESKRKSLEQRPSP
jgi:hypothetical protein